MLSVAEHAHAGPREAARVLALQTRLLPREDLPGVLLVTGALWGLVLGLDLTRGARHA